MVPSARYIFAIVVNVALPATTYWIAKGRFGPSGALIASAVPLLAWMGLDFARFRHFDALSAVVLAGIVMSVLVLVPRSWPWLGEVREPLVSGIVGVFFLLSLSMKRPLVFYLARSTMARERSGQEKAFDAMWQSRPALRTSIRLMTVVWGLGLVGENAVRFWMAIAMNGSNGQRWSMAVRYATYAGLMLWTVGYRRWYVRRQGG
ncbi:VC0807 family protein [Paraburkholderia caballeronis]|uniref:Intracellular septation protein A n=1 Tax=Paraburkholderia caballeronis TaxID=416943 RepID=A0A1H7S434_9BURK|nr:VC0807 family protein [Paraburkholderia caballeronis]PXW22878.1 hypothetical protein C7403_11279 [Paraburkholderia caballeronis]PXW97263.1 hypothetical protein C7407_11279 [Paraburkholderia caballeronis]RAJ93783.1 hypothetical protein C7409_11279 [Paraburkholderia caballeronis]SED58835.1 hypothetical protein SAMN05445871_3485 [Paraburkholderia caballeronis]SEL67421.1 hypothetical protein SAMN05192542_11179 [Paraburkholderia caballeronis]